MARNYRFCFRRSEKIDTFLSMDAVPFARDPSRKINSTLRLWLVTLFYLYLCATDVFLLVAVFVARDSTQVTGRPATVGWLWWVSFCHGFACVLHVTSSVCHASERAGAPRLCCYMSLDRQYYDRVTYNVSQIFLPP